MTHDHDHITSKQEPTLNEFGALDNDVPYGLGLLTSKDTRDSNYLARDLLSAAAESPLPPYRYHPSHHHHLNQGSYPHCVGFGLTHLLLDSPITGQVPFHPSDLYYAAQKVDEWEGEDYSGTSGRAGAKILQQWGYISNFYWAYRTDTITNWLLTKGPVAVGTSWLRDMFKPDAAGVVTATGSNSGGHLYLLNGVNTITGYYRIKNSWGTSWGRKGHAFISIADFEKLLPSGEALMIVETPRKK